MGFVGDGGNIAIVTALPLLNLYCIVFKYLFVHGSSISYFLSLPRTSVPGCGD